MKTLSLQSIIKRNPGLVSSEIDSERIMMNIETGEYFGLDSVGNRIWELIENPIQINNLIKILLDEFDVTQDQCETDTLEFIKQLLDKELVIITD
jgi:hypothetical protein